ncbi:MAG: hypothetical protein ABIJ52_03370 [Pseudomonadota bacterium]|nr:hypothetical protein [Pseudomonadota bacterium]
MELDIRELSFQKIKNTVKTCVCLCSGSCKKEALEGLRDQVVRLFDEAIEHNRRADQ